MKGYKQPTNRLKTKRLLPLQGRLYIVFRFYGKHSPRGKSIQATDSNYNVRSNIDQMIKNSFFSAEAKYFGWVNDKKPGFFGVVSFSETIEEGLYDDVVIKDYLIEYAEYDQKVKRVRRKNHYYNNIYRKGKLQTVVQEKNLSKKRINRNEFVQGINEEDTDLKTRRVVTSEKGGGRRYVKVRNDIDRLQAEK